MNPVLTTKFDNLKLFRAGKVRDVYEIGDYLLIVATDRISAFDVIMNDPIPEKGKLLSQISAFWFDKTKHIVKNHFITNKVSEYPAECQQYADVLEGRSQLVRRCKVLPIEAIVRGYITGSGWKEYKKSQTVCSIQLPAGLKEFQKLPEAIFTPSTKAEVGHDENISYEETVKIIGTDVAERIKELSLGLYNFAAEYLEKNNLILADTKFEFGMDENGEIILVDEALTPDSSRFWLKEEYDKGGDLINFDKQVLRDWLETQDWNKMPPPPQLPKEVIERTTDKYREAFSRICR